MEFLAIMLPLLILTFCLIQTALLAVGKITVGRATNAAVRAAVVVLDDDPHYYGGGTRNSVSAGGSRADHPLEPILAFLDVPADIPTSDMPARLQDIRAAAATSLLALSPPVAPLLGTRSVFQAVGSGQPLDNAVGAALYTRMALAVTFPEAPGSEDLRTEFHRDDDVTVRVSYLFHCGVPMARWFMCRGLRQVLDLEPELYMVEDAAINSGALDFRGAWFRVIQHEATLPNQASTYDYL
jgi:hypothetical protein